MSRDGVRPGDPDAIGDAAREERRVIVCFLRDLADLEDAGVAQSTLRNAANAIVSGSLHACAALDRATKKGFGASSDANPTEREAATRSGDAAPAPGKGALSTDGLRPSDPQAAIAREHSVSQLLRDALVALDSGTPHREKHARQAIERALRIAEGK